MCCRTAYELSLLRALLLYRKVATFKLGLRKFTLCTTFVLKSVDFRGEAAEAYLSYYLRIEKLRLSSWGCKSVLRVLLL